MKRLILLFTIIVILITIPADTLMSQVSRLDGTIDMSQFLMGTPDTFPRIGYGPPNNEVTHMNQVFDPDHRFLALIKFRNPQKYEVYSWDDQWIYHHEDRSELDQANSGTNSRWAKRHMRIGETINNSDNYLIRYNSQCQITERFWFPYKNTLEQYVPNFDVSPSLGRRDLIVLVSRPDPADFYQYEERFFYAKGAGWIAWQMWQYGVLLKETRFNELDLGAPDVRPDMWPCTPPRR